MRDGRGQPTSLGVPISRGEFAVLRALANVRHYKLGSLHVNGVCKQYSLGDARWVEMSMFGRTVQTVGTVPWLQMCIQVPLQLAVHET